MGRFLQADTILPVQQGTQAWDRYAYINNNPVNGTDPTGHRLIEVGNLQTENSSDGPDTPDNASWVERAGFNIRKGINNLLRPGNHTTYSIRCEESLSVCFNQNSVKVFEDRNVGFEEFTDFLYTVATDVDKRKRSSIYMSDRHDYDSSFFHGGFAELENETICVLGRCDSRDAINYVGQGMLAAKSGQSLEVALEITGI